MSFVQLQGLERIQARIERMAARNVEAASEAARAGADYVHSVLVTRHLNGQSIGRVDHALIGGWHVRGFTSPPGAVLGTSIPYARAQEYGFSGTVQIPEHTRRKNFPRRRGESRRSFTARRTRFQESPEGGFDITVSAHSRRMNLAPRSFLRNSIADSRPDLGRIMAAVWRRALAG